MNRGIIISSVLFCLALGAIAGPWYQPLGSFSVPMPSFLALMQLGRDATDPMSLIISSFDPYPFTSDGVYSVLDAAGIVANNVTQTKPVEIITGVTWPNEVEYVDASILGKRMLAVPGGFLVPWKSTGGIWLIDISNFDPSSNNNPTLKPIKITQDKSSWFYHRVRFYDVNGDGRQDIITARAEKGVFDNGQGELLWLEQPAKGPFSGTWNAHPIAKGTDFFFELYDLDNDGVPEIMSPEYFGQQIQVFYTTTGSWNDSSSVQSVVIDKTLGNLFSAQFADLNGDGKMELLATNHVNDAKLSGLYAYEIPQNWKTQPWPRHTLFSGIPTRNSGQGQASPGQAVVFYPYDKPQSKNDMPHIVLSGDGSQMCYLLMPNGPFNYTVSTLVNVGGTVGTPAVGDVDNDGYVEIFVPAYDANLIYAFTFAPSDEEAQKTQQYLQKHGRGFSASNTHETASRV